MSYIPLKPESVMRALGSPLRFLPYSRLRRRQGPVLISEAAFDDRPPSAGEKYRTVNNTACETEGRGAGDVGQGRPTNPGRPRVASVDG